MADLNSLGKVAFIFPGQGSQYEGMGKDLYEASPAAKAVFDLADEALGVSLSKLCFEGPEEELTLTVNAQPALLTMSMACLAALKEKLGDQTPEPAYAAGHSLGEYSALVAAEAMDFGTAVKLARERGRLMYEAGLAQPGGMASIIGASREVVQEICEECGVYIANLNCPGQIAVSGDKAKVKTVRKAGKQRGVKLVIPLQVSGAFHSPLMKPASDELAPQIAGAQIADAKMPVVANVTATPIQTAQEIKDELTAQVCSSVQWEDSMRYIISQGVQTFIEIGSGNVLAGLMKRIDPSVKVINIGTAADIEAFCQADA